jgi:hypothetical protein
MIRKLPVIICLALAGCASKSFSPDQAPEYVIVTNFAPFYKMGPMQPGGPDGSLPLDTRVKMMSHEMGYSRVQLEDMRTGYVANENLSPAPPKPPEVATSGDAGGPSPSGRKKRGARYTGAQVNDTPLPDAGPPPDLNIAPEIMPDSTPLPTPPPEPPKFRY